MQVTMMAVTALTPYEKNAKMHNDTQIDNVAESIRQFGFVQPIVVDRDGVIIIGHCRMQAALKLGLKEVPCVRVDDLTEDQVKALRIVDNKANESPWDIDLLKEELDEINLDGFDFEFGTDSLLDSFDEESFSDVGASVLDKFAVTFNFPNEEKANVDNYIKAVGKDFIVDMIVKEAIANA